MLWRVEKWNEEAGQGKGNEADFVSSALEMDG